MENFKSFTQYILENYVPAKDILLLFTESFNYNKVELGPEYNRTKEKGFKDIEAYLKKEAGENLEGSIQKIEINAIGYSSWVPTDYKNKGKWVRNNNIILAQDRARSILNQFRRDLTKFLTQLGVDVSEDKIVVGQVRGKIDDDGSRRAMLNFIRDKYEDNPTPLVDDMLTSWSSINDNQNPANATVRIGEEDVKLTRDNAQEVYDRMVSILQDKDKAHYIRYTSKLGGREEGIEAEYRRATQKSILQIRINSEVRAEATPKTTEVKPVQIPHHDFSSITFVGDSYQMDGNGRTQYQKLVEFLKEVDPKTIYNILFIGHAEGNPQINKKRFSLESTSQFPNASGALSAFKEFELEDLRFILGWSRAKEVYNQLIKDYPTAQTLMKNHVLWLQSLGTYYGEELKNQRCVQIVIWFKKPDASRPEKGDPIINTEPVVQVGSSANGPTAQRVLDYWKRLQYNPPAKFHKEFMAGSEGRNLFTNYIKDMMNRKNYEEFKSEYSR